MEQARDPIEGKGHRSSRPFRHLFKHDHFTAMLMTSGRNLFRNVVDLEERRMAFWFGYKSAYTLHAHQRTLNGQFSQRPVDGHATHAEQIQQFTFRGQFGIGQPRTGANLLHDDLLDPCIKRGGAFERKGLEGCIILNRFGHNNSQYKNELLR
ncbi:hypothetical protein D3C81_1805240 [compost metagenome]